MKKFISLALTLLLVLSAAACAQEKPAQEQTEPEIAETEETTTEPETVETTEPETEEETQPEETKSPEEKEAIVASVVEILKGQMGSYDNFDIVGSQAGILISFSMPGVSEKMAVAKQNKESAAYAECKDFLDSVVALSESVAGLAESFGIPDVPVGISLLNDVNPENVLFLIFDGKILYNDIA